MAESNSYILDGWVICPYCFSKNLKLTGNEEIKNLRMRCRKSTGKSEHFFMVNVSPEGEKTNEGK